MRGFRVYLAVGVIALLLVAVAVYYAQQKVGLVAVIRIKGYILTSDAADYYRSLIKSASENSRVKAVVVVVDSFGGYSNYVEQLYLSLKHLNGRKPVVAVAVNALSGGYYICAAASYIFAHPSSFVGAVGVISTAPPLLVPSEVVLETGPYKHTGFSRLLFFSNLSHALDAFLSAIEEGRGPRLRASREELSRGLIYLGTEAVKLGLVDAIGTLDQAVEEAARRAGLAIYRVVELGEGEGPRGSYYSWSNVTASLLESLHPPPALYYAYVPATALASGQPWQWPAPVASGGKVVVDLSHGNVVSWWSLDALLAELAQRNVTASFYSSWSEVERALDGAACLVVAVPTRPYSEAEVERVEEFVRRGGVLLLLFDPSYEYVGPQGLSNYVTAPINSLAAKVRRPLLLRLPVQRERLLRDLQERAREGLLQRHPVQGGEGARPLHGRRREVPPRRGLGLEHHLPLRGRGSRPLRGNRARQRGQRHGGRGRRHHDVQRAVLPGRRQLRVHLESRRPRSQRREEGGLSARPRRGSIYTRLSAQRRVRALEG
jgi:signal peptide peptidase SppA